MTTVPSTNIISSRADIMRQWKQGLISLSAEELDWAMFGIDTSREFGMPVSDVHEDLNPDDFDDFECS
jgi:hypothetical protein